MANTAHVRIATERRTARTLGIGARWSPGPAGWCVADGAVYSQAGPV